MTTGNFNDTLPCSKPLLFLVVDRPRKRHRLASGEVSPEKMNAMVKKTSPHFSIHSDVLECVEGNEQEGSRTKPTRKYPTTCGENVTRDSFRAASNHLTMDALCANRHSVLQSSSSSSSSLSSSCSSVSPPPYVRLRWDSTEMGGSPVKPLHPFLRLPEGNCLIFRRLHREEGAPLPSWQPSADTSHPTVNDEDPSVTTKTTADEKKMKIKREPPKGKESSDGKSVSESTANAAVVTPFGTSFLPSNTSSTGSSSSCPISLPSISPQSVQLQKVHCGHTAIVLNCTADSPLLQENECTGVLPSSSSPSTTSVSPSHLLFEKDIFVWDEVANVEAAAEQLEREMTAVAVVQQQHREPHEACRKEKSGRQRASNGEEDEEKKVTAAGAWRDRPSLHRKRNRKESWKAATEYCLHPSLSFPTVHVPRPPILAEEGEDGEEDGRKRCPRLEKTEPLPSSPPTTRRRDGVEGSGACTSLGVVPTTGVQGPFIRMGRPLSPSMECATVPQNFWEKASESLVGEWCEELLTAYYADPTTTTSLWRSRGNEEEEYLQDIYCYPDHRKDDEYDSNAEDFEGNDYPQEEDEEMEKEMHDREEEEWEVGKEESDVSDEWDNPYCSSGHNRERRDEWEKRVANAYHSHYSLDREEEQVKAYLPGYEDEEAL